MQGFEKYDVVVIGAGHAGIEAALAAARLGSKTALFTLSLDAIGNMPCNPSIGGTAKGHLVFEIDALGGEMGLAADSTALQSRMLNLAKGPAVHSLRVQSDRRAYHAYMKNILERQDGLALIQDEVVAIETERDEVIGIRTRLGSRFATSCAVLATGTYLGGRIYVGDTSWISGPDSITAATALTQNLVDLGLPLRRFKTGTPARVHADSIDFTGLEKQFGDEPTTPFSLLHDRGPENKSICYIANTNEKTHEVIRRNIHRAPMYNGTITAIGPRYCPSIEDKVMRFPDKTRHQIFVEPCGHDTREMYLQGMSSSLPIDVQCELYRTIQGFERLHLMRAAYAIEYDCIDPQVLSSSLEIQGISGLYGCGQFNGTSGYEEAAAQGLIAGINASRKAKGESPFVLTRQESYIGTLIDDLVTKGTNEPYRMMTSRSEYRLVLRQDNADIRLCEKGRRIGLLSNERYEKYLSNKRELDGALGVLRSRVLAPSDRLNAILSEGDTGALRSGSTVDALLRRPGITIEKLAPFLAKEGENSDDYSARTWKRAEIEIKYEGYIKRQQAMIDRSRHLEETLLPPAIDYLSIQGLRLEAQDKLRKIKPRTLGQAGRISGVNPADIAVLQIYLKKTGENI